MATLLFLSSRSSCFTGEYGLMCSNAPCIVWYMSEGITCSCDGHVLLKGFPREKKLYFLFLLLPCCFLSFRTKELETFIYSCRFNNSNLFCKRVNYHWGCNLDRRNLCADVLIQFIDVLWNKKTPYLERLYFSERWIFKTKFTVLLKWISVLLPLSFQDQPFKNTK